MVGDKPSTSTHKSNGRPDQSLSQTLLNIIEKQPIVLLNRVVLQKVATPIVENRPIAPLNRVVPIVPQEAATAMVGTAMSEGSFDNQDDPIDTEMQKMFGMASIDQGEPDDNDDREIEFIDCGDGDVKLETPEWPEWPESPHLPAADESTADVHAMAIPQWHL